MSWVTVACGLALTNEAMSVSNTALSSARQCAKDTVPVAGLAATGFSNSASLLPPPLPAVELPREVMVGPTHADSAPPAPSAARPVRNRRRSMVNGVDIVVSSVLRVLTVLLPVDDGDPQVVGGGAQLRADVVPRENGVV